jgi:hypothetical protein
MKFGKKLFGEVLVGVGLLVGVSAVSAAPTVTYGASSGTQCATTNDSSQTAVEPLVESAACANGNVNLLYKADVGSQLNPATIETGSFAGSYNTVFFNTALDPEDATISFTGGLAIDCSLGCFLSVKDGNATPATYVFNISNWDGTSDIVMLNFWEDARGAISNVAIWGPGGGKVPEPGTLGLLGLGMLGLVALRRRLAR